MVNPAGSEAKLENKQRDSSLAKCKRFRGLSVLSYPITQSNILQIKAINSQITRHNREGVLNPPRHRECRFEENDGGIAPLFIKLENLLT